MTDIVFLTIEEVCELHRDGLALWGGQDGLRSRSELASAVGMAEQGFGGDYFHKDLFAMAAAYAFHIAQNQPFVDGNKRTGAAAALVFLEINGISFGGDVDDQIKEALLAVARQEQDKAGLAELFRTMPRAISPR